MQGQGHPTTAQTFRRSRGCSAATQPASADLRGMPFMCCLYATAPHCAACDHSHADVSLLFTLLYSLSLCCADVMAPNTDSLFTRDLMLDAVPYSSPNIFCTREICNNIAAKEGNYSAKHMPQLRA
eukprot:GHUV01032741.1.p1 GENE.GHUV01032741.1~~GHUV01032741.1.p1  ORF type:complete len:126 (+),score=21.66 GHUV01032741.1:537-914(+)